MGKVYHYRTYEESVEKIRSRSVTLDISLRRGSRGGGAVWLPLAPHCHNRDYGNEGKNFDHQFHLVVSFGRRHQDRHHHNCEYSHRRPRDIERISHDDARSLYHTAPSARDGPSGVHTLRHRDDLRRPQAAPGHGPSDRKSVV